MLVDRVIKIYNKPFIMGKVLLAEIKFGELNNDFCLYATIDAGMKPRLKKKFDKPIRDMILNLEQLFYDYKFSKFKNEEVKEMFYGDMVNITKDLEKKLKIQCEYFITD